MKPLGFAWLLNYASPRRTPALIAAGVFDDGILKGSEASSVEWTTRNAYFNSKVAEITTSSCEFLESGERLGEQLQRLTMYSDIAEMPDVEVLKTKAPRLESFSFEI